MTAISFAPRLAGTSRRTAVMQVVVDVLSGAALVAGALAVVMCAYAAARRIGSPFELEWMEGGTLLHVERVLHDQPLYGAPTVQWTPNIYPPMYYWVSALFASVGGASLTTLRAVSVLSTMGVAACVWRLVRIETGTAYGPAVAVGLLFAVYRIGGEWFDVARVDMLFLAFLFAGLLVARQTTRPRSAVLAAALMVLAVFTKQEALLPALSVVPWLWTRGARCALAYVGAFAGGCVVAFAALQRATHGWFEYYVFTVPAHHAVARSLLVGFWTTDLLRSLWPSLVLVVAGLVVAVRRSSGWFHAPVFAALVLTSYSARLHTGGWQNVLLPAYFGIALLAGIAAGDARFRVRQPLVAIVATALLLMQFALLAYAPSRLVPPAGTEARGDRLVSELHALRGPILLTGQPWLLVAAGHGADVSAQASALQDVLRAGAGGGVAARRLAAELEGDIRTHRFCTIVTEQPAAFTSLPLDTARYYTPTGRLLPPIPVTGLAIAPTRVWVPKHAATCGLR